MIMVKKNIYKGRIVYVLDDKTEKVIYEKDTLNLPMLFRYNSR